MWRVIVGCVSLLWSYGWAQAIVFIHIGEKLPQYLEIAVAQARLFNQECPIFVVANERALRDCSWNVRCVAIEMLPKTQEHVAFCSRQKHWGFTSERFLVLYDLMKAFDLKEVVHLENDILLYVDLEELLPCFREHYPEIGLTYDSNQRAIGGFVYVANQESMQKLASFFAQEKGNDMEVLGRFEATPLPVIPDTYDSPLRNRLRQRTECPSDYWHCFEHFQSIFDAAAIGQYLGGGDGFTHEPGFINETCLFNPSFFIYEWHPDAQGRNVPYAIYRGQRIRINNLHIHSKQLFLFAS